MKKIIHYLTAAGVDPFGEWLGKLEWQAQAKVDAYIVRVASGASRKNVASVGEGVFEIKIDTGPGYRVYFGEVGSQMILLLFGGNKGSQSKDILFARRLWRHICDQNKLSK